MKTISILLIVAAIVCALLSDKIDMAVQGNSKVKKIILTFSVGAFLLCAIVLVVVGVLA